jgi:dTDP-4-amino-4,6-dideoxygalactose transaminase
MEKIPVFQPHIGVDTKEHVGAALDAGWLGMGAITKEFEERIARFLELKDVSSSSPTPAHRRSTSRCAPPASGRAMRF